MQYVIAVVSGRQGIFPLDVELNEKSGPSKIVMQIDSIRKRITAVLRFNTMLFDSRYFASKLIRFLEGQNRDWITKAKGNGTILVNGSWVKLRAYAVSLNIRNMDTFSIGNFAYLMESIITRMKNAGKA